jgi:diacylglycerol kinase (ATP)
MNVALLVNPASGRGRGRKMLAHAVIALENAGLTVEVFSTSASGDESRLAAEACARGHDVLAVLGGDGTWSQAARGVIELGAGERCRLAFLAAGTGNDLVKSLGVPADDYAAMARLIAAGGSRAMDAGRVGKRVFINTAGFGFDAAVLERTMKPGRLRGDLVYVIAALRELFSYDGLRARIDGGPDERHMLLVFANGRWFGGTFQIAPGAEVADGLLDAVAVKDASPLVRLWLFVSVILGRHLRLRSVDHRTAATFTLHFRERPMAQVDGELVQMPSATVTVEVVPRALRIVA